MTAFLDALFKLSHNSHAITAIYLRGANFVHSVQMPFRRSVGTLVARVRGEAHEPQLIARRDTVALAKAAVDLEHVLRFPIDA